MTNPKRWDRFHFLKVACYVNIRNFLRNVRNFLRNDSTTNNWNLKEFPYFFLILGIKTWISLNLTKKNQKTLKIRQTRVIIGPIIRQKSNLLFRLVHFTVTPTKKYLVRSTCMDTQFPCLSPQLFSWASESSSSPKIYDSASKSSRSTKKTS